MEFSNMIKHDTDAITVEFKCKHSTIYSYFNKTNFRLD